MKRLLAPAALLALGALVACGPPPPPLVPAIDLDRYCAARVVCGIELGNTNPVATCVANQRNGAAFRGFGVSFEEQRRIDCFLTETTCAGAIGCASRNHDMMYCLLHPGVSCDGNVRVDCANMTEVTTVDCARLGMMCRPGSTPRTASCNTGRTCAAGPARCEGNTLVECVDGFEARSECETVQANSRCLTTDVGARCIPPNAPSCSQASFTERCEEMNVRVTCGRESGRETRARCGANTTCTVSNGRAVCQPNSTTCSDGEADTCMGTSLQYCLDNQRVTVPCSVVGTSACGAGMNSAVCQ